MVTCRTTPDNRAQTDRRPNGSTIDSRHSRAVHPAVLWRKGVPIINKLELMSEPTANAARRPSEEWLPPEVVAELKISTVGAIKSLSRNFDLSFIEAKGIVERYLKRWQPEMVDPRRVVPPALLEALARDSLGGGDRLALRMRCAAFRLMVRSCHRAMDYKRSVPRVFALESYGRPTPGDAVVRHLVVGKGLYCVTEHALPHPSLSLKQWGETTLDAFFARYFEDHIWLISGILAGQDLGVSVGEAVQSGRLDELQMRQRKFENQIRRHLSRHMDSVTFRMLSWIFGCFEFVHKTHQKSES